LASDNPGVHRPFTWPARPVISFTIPNGPGFPPWSPHGACGSGQKCRASGC